MLGMLSFRNEKNKRLLPFNITFPNTDESRSRVLQFHLWFWNCDWHSRTPILAPWPILTMTSGCRRHNRRCLPTSPGILSHRMPAPTEC